MALGCFTHRNFATLTQDKTYVSNYFTKLKMYWDELQLYCPIDACLCGCECKATRPIIVSQECEFILQFLMGLNDKFTHIRGQILISDPLPSINKKFSLIIQEEEQLGNHSLGQSAVMAIMVDHGRNNNNGGSK